MPNPWERYQQGSAPPPEGPWSKYQEPTPAGDAPRRSSVGFKPEMFAPLEAALQVGTGAIAEPVSGILGLLSTVIPGAPPAGNVVRDVQSAMTYQPRTANLLPQLIEDTVAATPEFIKRPVRGGVNKYSQFEQWASDNYGPAAGAAVATLPTAILEAIPAGVAVLKLRRGNAPAPQQYAPPGSEPQTPQAPGIEQYQQLGADMRSASPQRIIPAVEPDMQIMDDAQKLGISLNPSHYSTNRAYIDMEQALKSRPGSLLSTVEERAIIDLGNRADDMIDSFGGAQDKSALDSVLSGDFTRTIDDLETRAEELYTKVNEAIPRATRVDPATTRSYIQQQLNDFGGDESLLTGAEKDLLALTTGTDERPFPTYAALDRVRKNVGAAIGKKQGPYKDAEAGQLKALYAVLLEDQQKFADAFGVGDVYRDGSSLVKQRKALEEQSIALFGRDVQGSIIPKLRQAAGGLSQGDVSKLANVMEAVPEPMRQAVAATLLNDIFASGARRNAPIGQGFVNAFAGLNRNAAAKEALFKYLPPEAEERFNQIGRVATGLYKAKALENTSRTARDVIAAMDDGGMFRKLYGIGARIAAAEGVSTAVGVPGAGTAGVIGSVLAKTGTKATKSADELLTSPGFQQAVKDYAVGGGARAQARLQNTPEYNAWLDAQNPSIRKEVVAIGLIPFLTAATPQQGQE